MELSPETFQELAQRIRQLCGLELGPHKLYLVRNRLEPIIKHRKMRSFEELAQRLGGSDLTLRYEVIEAITTHETSFFRDGHPFEMFRSLLLPQLYQDALRRGGPIRIWSAACSTGQEAYSLAILLREWNQAPGRKPVPFTLLATDISPVAVARAEKGEFVTWETARGLTAQQLQAHLEAVPGGYRFLPEVRRLITFRTHNLLDMVPPPGTFDLILCRNVLIYFDEATRLRILSRFHEALSDSGALILGAAENLIGVEKGWIGESHGLTQCYRKRVPLPVPQGQCKP